jgi:hypothetical protein
MGALLVGSCAAVVAPASANAAAWMSPERLSDSGEAVRFVDADVASDGAAVVVWERAVADETLVIRAATRGARGVSFGRAQDISAGGIGPSPAPAVAVDDDENAAAAWVAAGRATVSFRTGATGEWAPPVPVSAAGAQPPLDVAVIPGGDAVVIWSRPGAGVEAAVRSAATGTWSEPVAVFPGGAVPPAFSASTAPDGTLLVWTSSVFSVRRPGGGFDPPQPLPDGFEGSVAVAPQGEVIALRIAPVELSGTVEASIRPRGGAFGPFEPLATVPGGAAEFPRITVAENGETIAMWHVRPLPGAGADAGRIARVEVAVRPSGGEWSVRSAHAARPGALLGGLSGNAAGRAVGLVADTRELAAVVRPDPGAPLVSETVARDEGDEPIGTGDPRVGVEASGRATAVFRRGEGAFAATRRIEPGGAPALTAAQLRVNQRISAAAVRRANAAILVIEKGLGPERIRPGAFTRRVFAPGVMVAGEASGALRAPRAAVPVEVAPSERPGPGAVALSARQLLINQRISQAAVRRANALLELLDGKLTGGNLRSGSVTPELLAPGLSFVDGTGPAAGAPAATVAVGRGGARSSSAVRLNAHQLLINQRISQTAVRRTNEVIARLESGLSGASFAAASIGAGAVAP